MVRNLQSSFGRILCCVGLACLPGCGGGDGQSIYDPIAIDLKTLKQSNDVQARRIAANRLASNAPVPETAVEPLLDVIQNEREDEEVRCSAARALSKNDDAIDRLQAMETKLRFGPVKTAVEQATSRP